MTNPNIFATIGKDLSNAANFLITILTKGTAVANAVSRLSGPVLAAMLAVFHDVVMTVTAASAVAGAASNGNIPTAFTLSETTLALLVTLKHDVVAGEELTVADLKTLGLIKQ